MNEGPIPYRINDIRIWYILNHIIVVANLFKIYQVFEAEQRMKRGSNIPFPSKAIQPQPLN